jgi:hypothetical protein
VTPKSSIEVPGNSHLVVEHLGLAALGRRDQVSIEALQDILADFGKLSLDLLAVVLNKSNLSLVALGLLFLLDGSDDSPRGAAGTDDILVRDGQEISLLDGKLLVCGGNGLHVLNHFCNGVSGIRIADCHNALTLITFGLLGQLGEVD